MKKTRLLDIIRNITRRKVSFLAIMTIMVIGVGGILGMHFLVTSIDDCVTDYYRKHNFRDFEVISNMGISDEDVAKIASVSGVGDVEGVYKTDAILVHNGTVRSIDALSETERVSVPYLVSGEMPAGSNECAISYPVMMDMGIEVGETVNVLLAKPELDGLLKEQSMRVTGAVYHPDYVSVQNSNFVLFSPDAFDNSVMDDGYTGVFVTISSSDYKSVFSDDYFKLVSNARKNIRELLDELAAQKDADVRERAENEYKEAEDKINKDLSEAFDKLNDTQNTIESRQREFDEAKRKYVDGVASADLGSAKEMLKNGERDLEEARRKLDAGWEEYHENEARAQSELAEARKKIDNIPECNYVIQTRELNKGYAELRPFHDAMTSMVIYFSPMFAIIGSVVCFSTMVIVIDEQKKQVGSVKAFGFYNREIRIKYTVFGMAATALGCALGIGVARGIEYIVQDIIKNNYAFGQIPNIVVWPVSFIFIAVTMTVAALVVYIAVSRLIKCSAQGLLSGSEPKKRTMSRGGGSSRGTLYSRLIVNNVLMDVERVLVSLAVIAGSTVLVGTGLSMYVAVDNSYKNQDAMNKYDFCINISGPDIEELRTKTENILKESGVDYLPASFEYHIYNTGANDGAVPVLCTDPDLLENFISLKDYDGNVIVPKSRGMVVRQKFMENEGLEKGASFVLRDNSLVPHDAYIADGYVSPINQMAIMSREAYKAQFGEENVINCFYVRCNGGSQQVIRDRISELSEYVSMEDSDSFKEKAKVAKELCAMLAIIMVVLSLLMSLMILVNLTNILVERRMMELLVMRVNGFSLKQVIGYLLRESTFVTCLGIGLGIVAGIPFATSMVHGFEVRDFMYERKPYPWVWAAAVIMNLLFAAVIDFIAFRKVGKHSLTNITAD